MADIGYLLITHSADPDNTWEPIYLRDEITYLGRPDPDETKDFYITLDIISVSRKHARIVYENGTYVLENWQGRYNIGLFEQELLIGASHVLQHGNIFRIPNLSDDHFRIIFLLNDKTQILPIHIDEDTRRVFVSGDYVTIRGQEYQLLNYLYQRRGTLCKYGEILAHLWPADAHPDGRRAELDVLLSRIRAKIRGASGGFTFLQTIRAEGVRMVI